MNNSYCIAGSTIAATETPGPKIRLTKDCDLDCLVNGIRGCTMTLDEVKLSKDNRNLQGNLSGQIASWLQKNHIHDLKFLIDMDDSINDPISINQSNLELTGSLKVNSNTTIDLVGKITIANDQLSRSRMENGDWLILLTPRLSQTQTSSPETLHFGDAGSEWIIPLITSDQNQNLDGSRTSIMIDFQRSNFIAITLGITVDSVAVAQDLKLQDVKINIHVDSWSVNLGVRNLVTQRDWTGHGQLKIDSWYPMTANLKAADPTGFIVNVPCKDLTLDALKTGFNHLIDRYQDYLDLIDVQLVHPKYQELEWQVTDGATVSEVKILLSVEPQKSSKIRLNLNMTVSIPSLEIEAYICKSRQTMMGDIFQFDSVPPKFRALEVKELCLISKLPIQQCSISASFSGVVTIGSDFGIDNWSINLSENLIDASIELRGRAQSCSRSKLDFELQHLPDSKTWSLEAFTQKISLDEIRCFLDERIRLGVFAHFGNPRLTNAQFSYSSLDEVSYFRSEMRLHNLKVLIKYKQYHSVQKCTLELGFNDDLDTNPQIGDLISHISLPYEINSRKVHISIC